VIGAAAPAQRPDSAAAAAVTDSVLTGVPFAPPETLESLPRDAQDRAAEYRQRERTFHSALIPPRGAAETERRVFEKRIAIERVVFCLFPRRDIPRVSATYASDADVSATWDGQSELPRREAAFIDDLLRTGAQPWLAPYLNLTAGHRKLCASRLEGPESEADRQALADDARRQLARARDGGLPLIRVAAEYLLAAHASTAARLCTPSP
jgi:hypothetical protein